MKTRWMLVAAAAPVLLGALLVASQRANAENAAAAAPKAADAPPAGAAAPEAVDAPPAGAAAPEGESDSTALDGGAETGAGPTFPPFNEEPFAAERTPMPKKKEWESAQRVVFDAKPPGLPGACQAFRLREWIRVRCDGPLIASISLLGGDRNGLSLQLGPITDEFSMFSDSGEVVFPVRPGDRRVIEWLQVSWGYRGPSSAESYFVLSEYWLPEDARPVILIAQPQQQDEE